MKNFTKQNFKTNPLWIRLLIMTFMLLLGTSSVWGAVTIYFENTKGWSEVYVYLYNGSYWDENNGSGSQNIKSGPNKMTLVSGNIYKYVYNGSHTSHVAFTKDSQNNYGNFWQTEACYAFDVYNSSKPLFKPDGDTYTKNGGNTTYTNGTWYAYTECTSCCTNYYLQHPWDGGNWTWKELKKEDCNNNIYKLTAKYGNAGCDYSKPGVQEKQDYIANPILEGNPAKGDECIFTFDSNNKTITITKVVTCDDNPDFSVSLSKSEVAVGCTGVTASIKGNDSPTVTWSSSKTSVATINSSTGAITIKAAGTTTITATTTEAGGFCGGVKKTATLTVKSPSVTVKENDNSLCERETLTITATLTNCGEGNSIQWYKGDNPIADETSATLTISSVTTANSGDYKAVVSGGILCSSVESTPITITVNALPSAPSLSNPEPICYGTPFTLPEKDNNKKTITWNVNNRELTNLSVDTHTYTAKIVENGCESTTVDYTITVKEQLAKPDLAVTNVKQCGSNYTEGKIVINKYNQANTYILKKDGTPITKDYDEGYAIFETETGEYTVEVSKDGACGATSDDVTIEVINNTPTVNPFEITLQNNACEGNPVTLSYNDTEQSGTVSYAWYEGTNREVLGTEKTFTIQQAKNATYKLVVTVTSNSCPANGEAEITVSPKAVPVAPTFDQDEMSACVGERFELPMPNNLIGEEEALWTVNGRPTNASQTINVADDYKYIAYKNDGCPSQGTEFIVHVNPLPIINIGEDVTAVLYEDVVLTATGENIYNVVWTADKGTITRDANDPKKAVLTYDQTGDVIVTAKAISATGCESAEVSKKVTFGEEDCNSTTTTEQQKVGKIKVMCKKPSWIGGTEKFYCYAWVNNTSTTLLGGWPGTELTQKDGDYYYVVVEANNKDIKIILNDNSEQTVDSDVLYANNVYKISATSTKSDNKYTFTSNTFKSQGTYTEPVEVTVDPEITAPAVKTVSFETTPSDGNINFSGQIVKTGCDNSLTYGYDYKEVGAANWTQVVLGTDLDKDPGFTFSDNTIKDLDGKYVVRAFITNDNSTQYGAEITKDLSTTQEPVRTATIQLVDADGKEVDQKKYCVGETGYIKVTSDVKYSTATWKSDLGVEVEQIGKTHIYQFEVKGKDQIVVLLSNKYNTEPVSSDPLEVNVYTSPSVPEIALGASSICDTNLDGTTLTVTRTKAGQYYALYKEDGNGGTLVEDYQLCLTDNAQIEFTGLKEAAKYFVKTYTSECPSGITRSSSATLTVVDSKDVKISIEPTATETTPWMPVKLTVTATSDYTVTSVPNDAVINISGNIVKVKLPLPTEGVQNKSTTEDGVNVTFDNVPYRIIAELKIAGEEGNPCAQPAIANITLTPYIEICD